LPELPKSKPIAVLISDIHYSVPTLELADAAMRQAIAKANELRIPLIVAGDLHDTKANMRAECVNAMLETFSLADIKPYVLVGNHDRVNEKSKEHSLNFLNKYANIINRFRYPKSHTFMDRLWLVAYEHDLSTLKMYLKDVPRDSILIMHQGIQGSDSGEYIQDHSALTKENVAKFRVISGHYHKRQTIVLPDGGKWDYIGNPYTLNFGEASDPEKGFQILMEDGTLEFVPTNLRKHVIITHNLQTNESEWSSGPIKAGGGINDLVLVKVLGTKELLNKFDKEKWLRHAGVPHNAKIDLISVDSETRYNKKTNIMTQNEILDDLIDSKQDLSQNKKEELKKLWKNL